MPTLRLQARQWFKHWLARAGYELRRLPNLADRVEEVRPSAGRVVEFIGPSGVGKSTLFAQLALCRQDWMVRSEIERDANLSARFLARPGVPAWVYERLMFAKFEEIRELPLSSATKAAQVRYALNKLLADLAMRTRPPARGVITDDGICHNFSLQITQMAEHFQSPEAEAELARFLAGRALIRLAATPERVMHQLRLRHQATPGAGNDWLGHLGEAQARRADDEVTAGRAGGGGAVRTLPVADPATGCRVFSPREPAPHRALPGRSGARSTAA